MFIKPMLAEHKNPYTYNIKLTLAQRWANVGPTQKTHTAHKKLTLGQHWANVGPAQNQC